MTYLRVNNMRQNNRQSKENRHGNFTIAQCTINSKVHETYRSQAATHVGVGHREAGLIYGLLKHKVNDSLQPLLCVDREIRHLLHQLIEHLGRELVQNATNFSEQLLKCQKSNRLPTHCSPKSTKQPSDKINMLLFKVTNQDFKDVSTSNKTLVPDKNKSHHTGQPSNSISSVHLLTS